MADPPFDYARTKKEYMAQVRNTFDEHSPNSEFTINNTIDKMKCENKSYLHKNYEVSSLDGQEILVVKKKSLKDPSIQVLSFEGVFDIFMKDHLENYHKNDRQYLRETARKLQTLYQFPVLCLSLLVKSCNVCKSQARNVIRGPNKMASVYVTVMLQKRQVHEKHFRYLLIYIDKATDYVLLRPLQKKLELEVATEIFKILMQFGPPKKLRLYGYDKEFNMRVGEMLSDICPMLHFTMEYLPDNYEPSAIIVDKLQEWMDFNGSEFWQLGCFVVQKDLNMKFKQKLHKGDDSDDTGMTEVFSSHDLLFGKANKNKLLDEQRFSKHHEHKTNKEQSPNIDEAQNDEALRENNHDSKLGKLETVGIDENIVELRIPSPENFKHNLLDQLEDSELSQEVESLNDYVIKIKEDAQLEQYELEMEADLKKDILEVDQIIKTEEIPNKGDVRIIEDLGSIKRKVDRLNANKSQTSEEN